MKNKISIIIILIMAVAIGVLTYKLVTVEPTTEVKECEKQETQNIEVSYEDIKSLYTNFDINIDLLEKTTAKELTPKDFTDEEKFNVVTAYIFANELYEESTFDNSNGAYAQDKQLKITVEQIKQTAKQIFGDEKFDYLPEEHYYNPDLVEMKKEGETYICKQIISGHISGPGYVYYLNGYDIKNNQITVNVIAGFINEMEAGYGLYKDPTSTELLVKYENLDIETVRYYKDKLTNIKYIFDITEEGYQLNKITIN